MEVLIQTGSGEGLTGAEHGMDARLETLEAMSASMAVHWRSSPRDRNTIGDRMSEVSRLLAGSSSRPKMLGHSGGISRKRARAGDGNGRGRGAWRGGLSRDDVDDDAVWEGTGKGRSLRVGKGRGRGCNGLEPP